MIPQKPHIIVDGYRIKREVIGGGFKVVAYYHLSDNSKSWKKTLYHNLGITDAEAEIYRLERKSGTGRERE